MYATRGDRDRSRHRDRYSGSAATATAHVRVQLVTHARIKPPRVLNASACRARTSRCTTEGSCAASIGRRCTLAHKIAAQPLRCGRAAVSRARQRPHACLPPCRRAGHAAAAHQAAAAIICRRSCQTCGRARGSVDVSFSGGNKVGSRSKRCLPEVNPRCLLAGRHSSRDTLSTLPARRADLRGLSLIHI